MAKKSVKKLIKTLWQLKIIYDSSHIGAYSAQAVLFLLISLVPLAMLFVMVVTAVQHADLFGTGKILSSLIVPHTGSHLAALLKQAKQQATFPLVSVTSVFLVWTATKGMRCVAQGINVIYGTRGGLKQGVQAAVYTFGAFAAVVGTVLLWNALGRKIALEAAVFAPMTAVFALGYKIFSPPPQRLCHQLAGAATAAAGWIVFTRGYGLYIRYFPGYSAVYGSFGAVVLAVLWLYVCINILLTGALINKILAHNRER